MTSAVDSIHLISQIHSVAPPYGAASVVFRRVPSPHVCVWDIDRHFRTWSRSQRRELILHIMRLYKTRYAELVAYLHSMLPVQVDVPQLIKKVTNACVNCKNVTRIVTPPDLFAPPVTGFKLTSGACAHYEYHDAYGRFLAPACSCTCGLDFD